MKIMHALLLSAAMSGSVAAQTVTLEVASFPDLDRGIKAAIPLYQEAHPDVEIKLVSLAFGDHHNAMTTSLATGSNLPDVMAVEVGFIGKFAASGGIEDLSKPPYNAMQYQDQFARFTLPQATGGEGNLAAIPVDIGPGALFYRQDLLQKAGVDESAFSNNWDAFIEAGKKVKEKTGAYMVAHAGDLKDIIIRSDLEDGEGIFFDKENHSLVTSPRFEKAFKVAKAARDAGIDAKVKAWTSEWTEGLRRGQIATQMMGSWVAGHLANWIAPESAGLWRSKQLPDNVYASWGGSFYAIPAKAQHKHEAWEFIRFLALNKSMQLEAFHKLDAFPALVTAQNDQFLQQPIEFLGGQKARVQWKEAADRIPAITVNKYDTIADEIVNAELDKVLLHDKDIKEALADAHKLIKRRVRY
ncbi:ABC transporter substrate-binding protein [Hahella sp. NBU794]|uniref:ABC transporter substrate-binding protein n=1 Tax=Hahella sp. NBU794 TaxID=3422590 RepID=UPI003D7009AC